MNTKNLFNLLIYIGLSFGALLNAEENPPNILWITCEDISPNLGCYGDSVAVTPVLDQLASEGMVMKNACSISGVCAPSRSAIITGMYPTSIGTHNMRVNNFTPDNLVDYQVVLPPEVKCFTEFLRKKGYFCTNNKKTDYNFNAPKTAWDYNSNAGHWRKRDDGQPFFSVFNFETTHESRLWKHADHPLIVDPEDVVVPPYYPDTDTVRNDLARNYSNIYEMDQEVGELLDELKEDGLMDSTIIIFYSDHGGPLPRQKREINNGGIQVPMIIRFPNMEHAGTVNEELVSFIDLAPTVLSLAGVEIPDYIQGQAFLGDQKAPPREYVYAARDRLDKAYDISRSVRNDRYIYIRNYEPEKPWIMEIEYRYNIPTMLQLYDWHDAGKLDSIQELWFRQPKPEEELYDFVADPYEVHNLVNDTAYKDVLEELRAAHEQWKNEYTDLGFTPEVDLLNEWWPDFDQPGTTDPVIVIEDSVVTITCETEGASIGYQVAEITKSNPSSRWDVYDGPFQLTGDAKIFARAFRAGYRNSQSVEMVFGEIDATDNIFIKDHSNLLYPNPVKDHLFFKINHVNECIIKDITGKVLFHEKGSIHQVNTGSLNAGLYFISINTRGKVFTGSFVKTN